MIKTVLIKVHKSQIKSGDTIMHNGLLATVSKINMQLDDFMGLTIFGDSYNLGYKLVEKIQYLKPDLSTLFYTFD